MTCENISIPTINQKRTYTVKEAASILGVSTNTMYKIVHLKLFHVVKVGVHFRISKPSFDEWLDNKV